MDEDVALLVDVDEDVALLVDEDVEVVVVMVVVVMVVVVMVVVVMVEVVVVVVVVVMVRKQALQLSAHAGKYLSLHIFKLTTVAHMNASSSSTHSFVELVVVLVVVLVLEDFKRLPRFGAAQSHVVVVVLPALPGTCT